MLRPIVVATLLGYSALASAQTLPIVSSPLSAGTDTTGTVLPLNDSAPTSERPLTTGAMAESRTALPAQTSNGSKPEASGYDKIWRQFTTWYRNDSNAVVQQVLFSGRFQYEFAGIDADQGSVEEWNVRRMRFGPRVTLFRTFTLHAEVEVNPQEADPFYMRMTDAYLQWNKSSRLTFTFGKHAAPFTLEGATSSKDLLTIDRSSIGTNIWFPQEYMPGVSVSGRIAPWVYRGGVYSSGAMNREFGDFSGSFFTLAVLGYDFAKPLGVKEAVLTGNYVYQDPDVDNTSTRQLQHVVSVNFKLDTDRWGLRADLSDAQGYLGQSDMWAAMAMPFYNLTDKLQIVSRYTYVASDEPNGVRFGTYESRIVPGRGDEYNELYLGANYYFYGHRLKLQTGLQWADMNDRANDGGEYSGVAWTTGLRIGW
jgi:phosphate-selective porin OprO/OprP